MNSLSTHAEPSPSLDPATREILRRVGVYFNVAPPALEADDRAYGHYLEDLDKHLRDAGPLLSRLRNTAEYVDKLDRSWRDAREGEHAEKVRFLDALVEAARPALPAIAAPMFKMRLRVPGRDDLVEHWDDRGFVVIDRWRRDVNHGFAGRDVVLGEDGRWWALEHRALGPHPDREVQIHSKPLPLTTAQAIGEIGRRHFAKGVEHLVEAIYKNSRSVHRQNQIKESHDLVDTLAAVRTLLKR